MNNSSALLTIRITSILSIIMGAAMYSRGYSGRYGVEVTPFTALLFCFFGTCFLIVSFLPKVKEKLTQQKFLFDSEELICQNCKSRYKTKYVQIPVCPKCDGKLVEFE
ncbi:MAG: hypothetical protein GY699_16325 [Desulfobacteraceae bacterium]|nr:hypothetical protein [Desulfobacteraceae bacterium]